MTTRFAYDGWNPAKDGATGTSGFDAWAELSGSNALETRYLDGDAVDQVFGRINEGVGAFWLLADHLGSVRDVLNSSGTVVDQLTYDAFGNVITQTNAAETGRYTYTGQVYDTETGLLEERARFYAPTTGRWMSQDPMGYDAGDSNLYRYVNNAPTDGTDPSGLDSITTLRDGSTTKVLWQVTGSDGEVQKAVYLCELDGPMVRLEETIKNWSPEDLVPLADLQNLAKNWNKSGTRTDFTKLSHEAIRLSLFGGPLASMAQGKRWNTATTAPTLAQVAGDAFVQSIVVVGNELTFNLWDDASSTAQKIVADDPTFRTSQLAGAVAREALTTAVGMKAFGAIANLKKIKNGLESYPKLQNILKAVQIYSTEKQGEAIADRAQAALKAWGDDDPELLAAELSRLGISSIGFAGSVKLAAKNIRELAVSTHQALMQLARSSTNTAFSGIPAPGGVPPARPASNPNNGGNTTGLQTPSTTPPAVPTVPPSAGASAPATPLPTRAPHASTGRPPQSPLSQPFSTNLEPGTYVYVQDANGVVRVVPNAPGAHPTVLGGGQSAAAASELTVGPGGVITELNNIS